ncbi:MAG: sigma-54 dependent transcriptional regulator, partial [Bacteroidales bacterium]|nr:sigma-54 dependent transcriptional regulator [Bacteroidales bacterium]
HAIHALSARHAKPFGSIDLGCIPENLFESELFGHEKGAFTDARTAKAGRVEQANGGTLFLDEIGNLTLKAQQKLLTMIEKHEVSAVGSTKTVKVDVRIVSATNADLPKMVADGNFRQDLLYRINTIELQIPPLRERGNDIILLAEHFAGIYANKYDKGTAKISESAKSKLLSHSWPGNVRELQHCMERAVVTMQGNTITDVSISPSPNGKEENQGADTSPILNLEELERNAIRRAVSICNGNLTQAAEKLGITRYALYRKIEKLGI